MSVHVSVSGLRQLLVIDHFILQTNKNFFECVLSFPLGKHVELGCHLPILLVDARDINFGGEFDCWWLCRVRVITHDLNEVNSVVHVGVGRSKNSRVPVGKSLIIPCKSS